MKYFIIVIALLLSSVTWSQNLTFLFRGQVENSDLGKNEGGVSVAIVQNGSSVSSTQTASNGKYTLKGKVNYSIPFEVVFSKSGMVSKKVAFDFSTVNEEDIPASVEFQPIEALDMALFKNRPDVDFSFLENEPVAKFDWNEGKMEAKLDAGLVSRMKAKIDALLNDAEKDKAKLEADYQAAIRAGYDAFANKDYAGALAAYQKAGTVKPEEALPKTKVKELQDLIAINLANDSKNDQYAAFIKDAQNAEANLDYSTAISAYQKAGNVKPEEALPKVKIKELNALIAANGDAQSALDRDYKAAMELGEKLMTQEKYLEAIKAFNDALALKPTENKPKERAAAAEAAERKRGDGDSVYEKILTTAESKIAESDYDKAEELISRAISLKPEDSRPKELLEQVKQLRARDKKYTDLMASAETLATKKSYKEAITDFEKAKNAKPSETAPKIRIEDMNRLLKGASSVNQKEELYKDYMRKGQAAVVGEKFVEALGHYQNALSVKEGDQESKDKVDEIQQILDNLANSDAEKLAKKNKYDALIKEANSLFSQSKYREAKAQYDLALFVDPYSGYAKERSDDCAKLMSSEAGKEVEEQYKKLIGIADKNFNELNWEKAKEYYNRAITMKKSDPYPKKKLDQIDVILNPTIVQSQKLESLGDPFDGTIEDGGFLVMSDSEKKRFNKASQIQQEIDKVNYESSGLAKENQDNRLDAQNEIYAIWSKVAVSTDNSEDVRKANVEKLRQSEVIRQNVEMNNLAFEKGENLAAQGQLNSVKEEQALDYLKGSVKREENADIMHNYQIAQEKETINQGSVYTQKHYDTDDAMSKVAFRVDAEVKDDYDDRLEIESKVNAASDHSTLVSESLSTSKYDDTQRQKAGIDIANANASTQAQVNSEAPGENNQKVKSIKSDANEVALGYMQQKDEHTKVVNEQIVDVRRKVIDDNEGFDKVRTEANDRLKDLQSDHVKAEGIAREGETEKYRDNKARIDSEEEKRKVVTDQANEAMSEKIAYLEAQDLSARAATSQGELSDEEERLNARKKVEAESIAQSNKSIDAAKASSDNTETLKDVKLTKDAKQSAENAEQREKNLSTQQDLNKVSSEPKPKVIIANSLGQEYPEGVSQESFTRKDESGLVTTVITRRIVVIEGHANVYVRTQTSQGITYSKNDNPSLQHVWNSETQGPDLVRHY